MYTKSELKKLQVIIEDKIDFLFESKDLNFKSFQVMLESIFSQLNFYLKKI